ncbi:hypothetical protein AALA22_09025 [Anaerovoracaceae bacterium 41-7]
MVKINTHDVFIKAMRIGQYDLAYAIIETGAKYAIMKDGCIIGLE